MSAAPTPLDPPPTAASPGRLALRLVVVAAWMAALLGACDVALHGRKLAWPDAVEIGALWLLFGSGAALFAWPLLVAAIALLGTLLGRGRAALALAWFAASTLLVALAQLGALDLAIAAGGLVVATLLALRSWPGARFAAPAPWRWRMLGLLLLALGGALAPPLGRRASALPSPSGERRAGGRPDIVLIVLDTLRADHLGAYGDARGLSPAFDRFAGAGALYTRCYSAAPWTVPSHASLFTGLFPPTHGCSCEHHRWLDRRFTTIAEALRDHGGYQTAAFAANDYLFETQLLQGFETAEPLDARASRLTIAPLLELLGWPARFSDHGATEAVERIGRYVANERDPEQPLFLFVNLLEAHWRDLPPLAERLKRTSPEPGVLAATNVSRQFYGPLQMAGKRLSGPVEPSIRALYAAAVEYQDTRLQELLDLLGQRLDLDHTLIAITSDHGENLGEGGRWDHVYAVNEALVHVPLAIRYPPAIAAGTRIDGLCQLVDLPATLLDVAKPDVAGAMGDESDGHSLLPAAFRPRAQLLFCGDPYFGHLEAMANVRGFNRDVAPFTGVMRALSDGRRKLVRTNFGATVREQLFDPVADPAELHDLALDEAAVAAALRGRLDAALAALPGYSGPPLGPPEDPDERPVGDGLANIGYVR